VQRIACKPCSRAAAFTASISASVSLTKRLIATNLYGASEITGDTNVRQRFRELEAEGFGHFPICMAKTQYSFSTDPQLKGAPSGHVVAIREVRLSAGAEFIVVIAGDIMTMPGLPRTPSAIAMHLNEAGEIEGLS
jgi:formate--tetrahydrofolate ligase